MMPVYLVYSASTPAAPEVADEMRPLDVPDNTPPLDIKPYVPYFDTLQAQRIGWCRNAGDISLLADGRFEAHKISPGRLE